MDKRNGIGRGGAKRTEGGGGGSETVFRGGSPREVLPPPPLFCPPSRSSQPDFVRALGKDKQYEIARGRFCTQSCSTVGQLLVNSSPTPYPMGSCRGVLLAIVKKCLESPQGAAKGSKLCKHEDSGFLSTLWLRSPPRLAEASKPSPALKVKEESPKKSPGLLADRNKPSQK